MSGLGRGLWQTGLFAVLVAAATPAWAQGAAASSEGPGRITCSAPGKCQLDIGTPPTVLRFKVDATALPDADKARLAKCTAKATACIATVTGVEAATGRSMKASAIKWYN